MATYEMGDVYEVVLKADDSDMGRATAAGIVQVKKLDDSWRNAMNNQAKAMTAAAENTKAAQEPTQDLESSTASLGSTAFRMVGTFLSLRAALEVARAFSSMLQEMSKYAMDTASKTAEFQKALLSIKAMQGGGIVDEAFMRQNMNFMRATGMQAPEARDFRKQWAAETGRFMMPGDEKMDRKEYEQLEVLGAQYAAAKGADPRTMAILMGRIMAQGKKGEKAADVLNQAATLFETINMAPGDTSAVMAQTLPMMSKLMAASGHGMVGTQRALGMLSVGAAAYDPGQVGTSLEQFARATTGQSRSVKWNEFLRGTLKVKPGTHVEDSMEVIFKWLEEQEKAGVGATDALFKAGLTGSQERMTLAGMYEKRGVMESIRKAPVGDAGVKAQADIGEYYARGGGGVARGEVEKSLGPVLAGMKNQALKQYMDTAEGILTAKGEIGPEADIQRGFTGWLTDRYLKNLGGTSLDEIAKQQMAEKLAEQDMGTRVPRSGWQRTNENITASLGRMPGFGGGLTQGLMAPIMHSLEAYRTVSEASSLSLRDRLNDARDNRIDPNTRLQVGSDAQMHTLPEQIQIWRDMHKTNQEISAGVRQWNARARAIPQQPGRLTPHGR